MKRAIALIFLFAASVFSARSEDPIPVLLRVSAISQPDTLGYNFVNRITEVIYKEIIEGRAKLWDSREKEIQITGATLQDIERNSNSFFIKQQQIFIYENWQRNRHEITTTSLGFLFFSKNAKEEEVSFGYVDYKDVSNALLTEETNPNANGSVGVTLAYALNAKYFNFNLVQFGVKVFNSSDESNLHKIEYVGLRGFNSIMFPPVAATKRIGYRIEHSNELRDSGSIASETMIKNMEAILKTTDLFKKIAGYRMQNVTTNDIKISRIELEELRTKEVASIATQPLWMVIYLGDAPLDTLKGIEINQFELRNYNKSMIEILKAKKFNYVITKINYQEIKREETFLYEKALRLANWNNLIQYVEHY